MYARGTSKNPCGVEVPCQPGIPWPYARALYLAVTAYKPTFVLEVGMAIGTSSLAILAGLRRLDQRGRLVSIDPCQTKDFAAQGITNVRRAGFQDLHELVEEYDYLALPKLLAERRRFDLIYIDGRHTFDHVQLDVFYCDKLLRQGGIMAFNDCGWRAVHKVLRFLLTHRRYKELNVGLTPDFNARNLLFKAVKSIEGRNNADRYFQKVEDWEPPGDFFARF
jgi:predicted O-methyltransferase YrrM